MAAPEAVALIKQGWAVVVATTDMAYLVLRSLGKDHDYATQRTSGLTQGFSSEMFEMTNLDLVVN